MLPVSLDYSCLIAHSVFSKSKHPLVGDTHDFDYDFNYLSKTTPVPKTGCLICGESNHNAYKCRHVSPVECHNCHEFGHKAKFCRAKK